jgi:hypothetical protein
MFNKRKKEKGTVRGEEGKEIREREGKTERGRKRRSGARPATPHLHLRPTLPRHLLSVAGATAARPTLPSPPPPSVQPNTFNFISNLR